jgi:hypothetical protein
MDALDELFATGLASSVWNSDGTDRPREPQSNANNPVPAALTVPVPAPQRVPANEPPRYDRVCGICGALVPPPMYHAYDECSSSEVVYKGQRAAEFAVTLRIVSPAEDGNLSTICQTCMAVLRSCGGLCCRLDRSVDVLRAKKRLRYQNGEWWCDQTVSIGD